MINQVKINKTPEGKYVAGYEGGTVYSEAKNTPSKALRSWNDYVYLWLKSYEDRSANGYYRVAAIGYNYQRDAITIDLLSEKLGLPSESIKNILEQEGIKYYG